MFESLELHILSISSGLLLVLILLLMLFEFAVSIFLLMSFCFVLCFQICYVCFLFSFLQKLTTRQKTCSVYSFGPSKYVAMFRNNTLKSIDT